MTRARIHLKSNINHFVIVFCSIFFCPVRIIEEIFIGMFRVTALRLEKRRTKGSQSDGTDYAAVFAGCRIQNAFSGKSKRLFSKTIWLKPLIKLRSLRNFFMLFLQWHLGYYQKKMTPSKCQMFYLKSNLSTERFIAYGIHVNFFLSKIKFEYGVHFQFVFFWKMLPRTGRKCLNFS